MSAKTPTNALTNAIVELIQLRGGMAWRNNTGAFKGQYTRKSDGQTVNRFVRYGEKGSGDVLGLFRGVFLSVEVKTGKDKLTDNQIDWMERVSAHGGYAIEARSLDDVEKLLNELRGGLDQHVPTIERQAQKLT